MYIVDRIKQLISVWGMNYSFSGTFQTILHAKIRKNDLTVIDPVTLDIEKVKHSD